MDTNYWERIAPRFESEIFDVFANDRKGLITSRIRKLGSPRKVATDLGCGIGNFLPAMTRAFRHVTAVDISAKTLRRAKAACSELQNVSYMKLDLSSPKARLPEVDFALSVNTLLTPDARKSAALLDSTVRHIRSGGHLLLVVPSLESALLTRFRTVQWNLRDGFSHAAAIRSAAATHSQSADGEMSRGVLAIDSVPTKHFLKEELIALLAERRMTTLEARKIEYPWDTEFQCPPKWMKDPYPWDWLILAHRS
jgi:SAM-dependent methyltransferase